MTSYTFFPQAWKSLSFLSHFQPPSAFPTQSHPDSDRSSNASPRSLLQKPLWDSFAKTSDSVSFYHLFWGCPLGDASLKVMPSAWVNVSQRPSILFEFGTIGNGQPSCRLPHVLCQGLIWVCITVPFLLLPIFGFVIFLYMLFPNIIPHIYTIHKFSSQTMPVFRDLWQDLCGEVLESRT